MKFYAFNDDGGSKVNLLLDHNIEETAWNLSGNNTSGPKEVIEQLKTNTDAWIGTEIPTNYFLDQSDQTSGAKYIIDYSEYKARLITAREIAIITGNTTFDERTSISAFYFDTNTTTESSTCKYGDTSGCKYGWLYDRTSYECTKHGCFNSATAYTYESPHGYWTASSCAYNPIKAWLVSDSSLLTENRVDSCDVCDSYYSGIRPVIEVLKSKLK